MLLDTDRDENIDLIIEKLSQKVFIYYRDILLLDTEFKGEVLALSRASTPLGITNYNNNHNMKAIGSNDASSG